MENYDFTVLGAGIFGLYAANILGEKGLNVCLVEADSQAFGRASYINQARVHQGYHYPRSLTTARISASFFDRFIKDFGPAINQKFKKIYAVANRSSYTSNRQFLKFCEFCNIPAISIDPALYFDPATIEGAYETEEYSFDPNTIKEILLEKNSKLKNITCHFNEKLIGAQKNTSTFDLQFASDLRINSQGVFNCTYASINQVLNLFNFDLFDIKYEICEVALCDVSKNLKNVGITMMDGPFFSVMPFGKTGQHTLTAVEYTPRKTSLNHLPYFDCQRVNTGCTPQFLQNCNQCIAKPSSSFADMWHLAKKYLHPESQIFYKKSLFAIKPILMGSEMDDSRPTIVQTFSEKPKFVSVLSGKVNAIYELEAIVDGL